MQPFSWQSACVHVISLPESRGPVESVQQQLRKNVGVHAAVSPGVRPTNESIEAIVRRAETSCLVPRSYARDPVPPRWHGTVGSSLAHLALLHRAASSAWGGCEWAVVLADDVALLPGFGAWVEALMARLPSADFVNLATVRAWGVPVESRPAGRPLRVSGRLVASAWSGVNPLRVRSPNLLVSAYVVRRSTLPTLLDSFARTKEWGRRCSIDQVLARAQYALASAGLYKSFTVDATLSRISHCAVGPTEREAWAAGDASARARHAACSAAHPTLYGGGSRSHDESRDELSRRPKVDEPKEPPPPHVGMVMSLPHSKLSVSGDTCSHDFHVPHDRIVLQSPGEVADGPELVGPSGPGAAASWAASRLRREAPGLFTLARPASVLGHAWNASARYAEAARARRSRCPLFEVPSLAPSSASGSKL